MITQDAAWAAMGGEDAPLVQATSHYFVRIGACEPLPDLPYGTLCGRVERAATLVEASARTHPRCRTCERVWDRISRAGRRSAAHREAHEPPPLVDLVRANVVARESGAEFLHWPPDERVPRSIMDPAFQEERVAREVPKPRPDHEHSTRLARRERVEA